MQFQESSYFDIFNLKHFIPWSKTNLSFETQLLYEDLSWRFTESIQNTINKWTLMICSEMLNCKVWIFFPFFFLLINLGIWLATQKNTFLWLPESTGTELLRLCSVYKKKIPRQEKTMPKWLEKLCMTGSQELRILWDSS